MESEIEQEEFCQFGKCTDCGAPKTDYCWCEKCDNPKLEKEFENWTSGDDEIDEFIRDTQRHAKSYTSYLEWIPFEDFEDVKQIAKGGFGTVYHSWWKTGERIDDALDEHLTPYKRERSEKIPVALKRLNNSQSVSSEFLDELKAHHRCASYGMRFLKCYGISRHPEGNDLIMVMQFAKGGNLRQYLRDNQLDWQKKLDILHFIVHDLEALHNAGLVHRDFHSGNVMMRGTWAYLSDLGLCRQVKEHNEKDLILGIMQYIAPEVLRGKPYTPEADIYSFGIIMAEVTYVDKAFFNAERDANLALEITKENRRPRLPEGTPSCYRDLAERCWSSDKNKRPKVHKVKAILDQWRHNPPYNILQEFRNSDQIFKELPSDPVDDIATNNPAPDRYFSKAIYTHMDINTPVSNYNVISSSLITGTAIVDDDLLATNLITGTAIVDDDLLATSDYTEIQ